MPNSPEVSDLPYATPSKRAKSDRIFTAILIAGVAIRVIVFLAAGPFNADDHLEVIRWIADHGAIPRADLLAQSHHPPLYHALMAMVWKALDGSRSDESAATAIGVLHFISLLMSVLNLYLLSRFIRRVPLFNSRFIRLCAIGFASLLPQFVMFSSFVSNDSLTLLLGTLVFIDVFNVIHQPSTQRIVRLGLWVGLGMATKGTFLLAGASLAPIVIAAVRSNQKRIAPIVTTFCAIWIAIGCVKYVDNTLRVGRALVHNLDTHPDWGRAQKGVWHGWISAVDVDVFKLIRHPILQPRNPYSYPLLMYGTFWYPHFPDSTFRGNVRGYAWVGSLMYAVAAVPTVAFIAGFFAWRWWSDRRDRLLAIGAILLIVSNAAIVIGAGVKFDIWSCFQARLCFQSMAPALLLFAIGCDYLRRNTAARWIMDSFIVATIATCALYFTVEVGITYGALPASEVDMSVYQSTIPADASSNL